MRATRPILGALLTLGVTTALPQPEPGLLSSIIGIILPHSTTTAKATTTTAAATTTAVAVVQTPGAQTIEFGKVDAAPSPVLVTVPVLGTSTPVIQPLSAAQDIASSVVKNSPIASDLSKILKTILREKRNDEDYSSLMKRDGDCSAQPAGTGPTISPDTTEAFLAYEPFAEDAIYACTPDGYTKAFTNLQGSTQTTSYLGYITLDSYDTDECAASCNAVDGCQAFNIYFERDPSLNPNTVSCPDPAGLTNIKCAIWGVQVSNTTATNVGQWRDLFEVVITGSNGYNRDAPPADQTGYTGPIQLGGAMLAPLDPVTNTDTYITYQYFPFGNDSSQGEIQYYNPEVCTAACTATSIFDTELGLGVDGQGAAALCNMVVAYVLSDADVPQGVYCAMYTESWNPLYATNVGQFRENSAGGEDFWAVSQAYAYINGTYAEEFPEICATGGCAAGSYTGGSCGGHGTGTC